MSSVLSFREISKHFGSRGKPGRLALDRFSMDIHPGEIVGFLGPNGAGKTTALHLALGFLKPSSGEGMLFGKPFGDADGRRHVGFVPDQPVFFPGTAAQALAIAATFSDVKLSGFQIQEHLAAANLEPAKGDVRNFSRGMQQRLALEQALVHQPDLLLLDEPISALDPRASIAVMERLQQLGAKGVAVLLSSHQLEAVATIADRLILLDHGRSLLMGRPSELMRGTGRYELTFRNLPGNATLPASFVSREKELSVFICEASEQKRVISLAWNQGAELIAVHPVVETLTQLFLRVTKESKATGSSS